MGLYSNTRVSALNEYASEEFKRSTNVESLIEACIEIRENDYKMFESLLNLDFAEASMIHEDQFGRSDTEDYDQDEETRANYHEKIKNARKARGAKTTPDEAPAAEEKKEEKKDDVKAPENWAYKREVDDKIEAANESKIKKIWQKIVEFFQGIIDKIRSFFAKVIAKIREVIGRDKAIVEKYKDAFTAEKMNGFEGLSDISVPKLSPDKMQEVAKRNIDRMSNNFKEVLDNISAATDKDKVQAVVDEFKNETDDTSAYELISKESVAYQFFEKYEGDKKFVPTPEFMKTALESISSRSKIVAAVEKLAKDFDNELNKKKAELKKKESELKGKKDELGLTKASASFKLTQSYSAAATKISNEIINAVTKSFGVYRRLVLIVGKYALKDKAKKESKNESAMMDFAIGEASDLYIAEALGY